MENYVSINSDRLWARLNEVGHIGSDPRGGISRFAWEPPYKEAAVFFACMQPGDTFMGLDLSHGGHLSHGSPVNMSGKYFNAVGYQLDEATGVIDYDAMERKALECKPKVIVGGASAYSREWDYKRMRAIADKVRNYER